MLLFPCIFAALKIFRKLKAILVFGISLEIIGICTHFIFKLLLLINLGIFDHCVDLNLLKLKSKNLRYFQENLNFKSGIPDSQRYFADNPRYRC